MKPALRQLSPGEIAQDHVLIRLLEKAPLSKLSLLLPRGLKKIVFEKGVSLFGLTTATRAAVTLAVIGMAWWCLESISPKIGLKLQPIATELAALSVQTEPASASLLLDGKPPQEPPNAFTHVPFGMHRLTATLEGYLPANQDLEINETTSPKIGLKNSSRRRGRDDLLDQLHTGHDAPGVEEAQSPEGACSQPITA